MTIEHIFSKQLTRDINGVVKAEQVDNDSVFVELDEYVITQELDRHFRRFFETYVPAIKNRNPAVAGKIGVWVSGFFGSGKSHFIKTLSYLLENRAIVKNGETRHAIDFFKDKINDAMLFGDIHSAVSRQTDVILFNIDSRANTDDRENAILKVFLKVFNERVGYCADFPHIAHMERELDKHNQYPAFKAKFAELTGSTWEAQRDAYDFYRDELAESLAAASNQTLESTRQWVEQLETNLPLDIRNFCKWVNDYLDRSGDRNILFLVDEVGQFIGKNTQMMLKLQTITEDLGTFCGGRAWVIVTSQADIDAAIGQLDKRDGDDFSKIQGRFYTRLQLSSSNTSEVIQKRLLEKTETAAAALANVFAEKGDILRNQLTFDKTTTAALNSYTDAPSFVDNYPFVPYHYRLVQNVFESIRTKGATGKHLAMGERSLLDAFQSAAKQVKDQDIGVLIPFYCFYSPIESFLEPAVKRTIDQACELTTLTEFDSKILKTLFLIRYVDVLKSTLDNLVTLSIDQIDADKISLKKQIEESLNRLERQSYIARKGLVRERLAEYFPQVIKLDTKTQLNGTLALFITERYYKETGEHIDIVTDARHINDGMLRILNLLANQRSVSKFQLFDEIENGINPEITERLMDTFTRAPQQTLISTHSPMVLNYLDDETAKQSVILLYKKKNGQTAAIHLFSLPSALKKLECLAPGEAMVDLYLSDVAAEAEVIHSEKQVET